MVESLNLLNGVNTLIVKVKVISRLQKTYEFKIDTGSSITLLGLKKILECGVSKKDVKQIGKIKEFKTVSNEPMYAIQFPLTCIKLGDIALNLPYIFIPITVNGGHYKFISQEKLLLGTDVLSQIKYTVDPDNESFIIEPRKTKHIPLNYETIKSLDEVAEGIYEIKEVTVFG